MRRNAFTTLVNAFLTLIPAISAPLSALGAPAPGAAAAPASMKGQQAILARQGQIKIGLQQGARSLTVRVDGPTQILTSRGLAAQAAAGSELTASAASGRISVSLNGSVVASDASVALAPQTRTGTLETASSRYRGRLVLTWRGSGIDVVNQIMIDDWLKGVLPAEIGGEAPLEALKAQAVAARSEAVRKLIKPPHAASGYDFCTGVHCQAYKGMKGETAESNSACDSTLGIVLTADGEVLDGVYHNVCGGATALPQDVWNSEELPGFVALLDTGGRPARADLGTEAAMERFLVTPPTGTLCDPAGKEGYPKYAQKYYRWQKTVTASELQSAGGVGRVTDVQVTERRPSGRVRKLAITGERGTKVIERELPIRNALDLWSGLFVVRTAKDAAGFVTSAKFTGAGNGHGVGLCQHGARVAASMGAGYDKILLHYYAGAKLARIYRP